MFKKRKHDLTEKSSTFKNKAKTWRWECTEAETLWQNNERQEKK